MLRPAVWMSCQRGQTTAEYALVLLVAGLVVGVFAAVVKSDVMSDMFRSVIAELVDNAKA